MKTKAKELMEKFSHPEEEIRRMAVYELLDLTQEDAKVYLIHALGDDSWRVRKTALEIIFRFKDPSPLLPSLVDALRDEDNAGLRNSAIEALTSMGSKTIPFLSSYLKDRDSDLRKFIVEIIGAISGNEAIESLLTALKDENINVRLTAIEFLGKIDSEEVTDALLNVLKEGDMPSRFSALDALGNIGKPIPLEEVYRATEDKMLKKIAFELLKKIGGIDSFPFLLKGIRDPVKTNRETAMQALRSIFLALPSDMKAETQRLLKKELTTIPLEDITSSLNSPDIEVKKGAAFLLMFCQKAAAIPYLLTALSDENIEKEVLETIKSLGRKGIPCLLKAYPSQDGRIKHLMCSVLGELGDNQVEEMLIEALRDNYGHVRGSAAIALGKVGTRKSIRPLIPLLQDEYENVQEETIEAITILSKRYRSDILPILSDVLASASPSLKRRCVTLLGRIGGKDVLDNISFLLKDGDPEVRMAAISAIADLKGKEYLHDLLTALTDEDAKVRMTVVKAISLFKDKRVVDSLILSLRDEDLWVRYYAIEGLGVQEDPISISELKKLVYCNEGILSIKAIEVLKTLLGKKALPIFLDLLVHEDREIKKSALEALEEIGNRNIESRVFPLLEDEDWSVRKTAVQTLRKIGGAEVIDTLKLHLDKEKDPLVKESMEDTIEVLKTIGEFSEA